MQHTCYRFLCIDKALESVRLVGAVKARLVVGSGSERFLVTARAVKEWCADNGVSYRAFRAALKDAGFLKEGAPEKATITAGTSYPSTQENVLEFVYDRVSGVAPALVSEAKVVNLR